MKIRSKIALRYSIVTAILMTVFAAVVYFVSAHDRETEFYDDLYKEGVSKASLFFEAKASAETMHSIYKNNIEYLDEVEVAIYADNFTLLYHDAKDIDIVKETPELLDEIIKGSKKIDFYVDKYQATGFIFSHHNSQYIVTAAAYDGYGYNKLNKLITNLFISSVISILISFVLGYFLAKRALQPVSKMSDKMKNITTNNLHLRLLNYNENDEFGELAASFNDALNIIESSFEAQKMFIGNVSHELRTPLATLIGEIDLALLKQRTVEEYITTLEDSKYDVIRLIKLVNGLLDLAKASYDESKISMTDIRVDDVIIDARNSMLKTNPNYKIELQFAKDIEDENEITVKGNEYLLKTAFTNLMENNCKFSENKTSTIQISTSNKKISIRFSDTGIGILKEEMQYLATPFYRGKNKDFAPGNGIGLTLVNKVVSLHKGTFKIESTVGKGTVVNLEFSHI